MQKVFKLGGLYFLLFLGLFIILMPLYIAFVTSTHTAQSVMHAPIPLLPGSKLVENYSTVLSKGVHAIGGQSILPMMWNSFIMAMLIALGKISFSLMSAFAMVYIRFKYKFFCFWLIFLTLMLPVEVRIVPTFEVIARLGLLNSYTGLTLPLIASATATFLFRQFFLTIPEELLEAATIDGVGAVRFLVDFVVPLSKTNIAALFIIMFIYGWNQYLWPLVITTQSSMDTIVMGISKLASVADQVPQWNYIMAIAILASLPPVLVVLSMQRLFVKGLIETEK